MGRPRIVLRGVGPDVEGLQWESEALLRIGRLPSQEVVLNDASVSRRHAEIRGTPIGWVVRDLGSSNGTFLNGGRLADIDEKLHVNDLVQCGDLALLVTALDDGKEQPSSVPADAIGTDTSIRPSPPG